MKALLLLLAFASCSTFSDRLDEVVHDAKDWKVNYAALVSIADDLKANAERIDLNQDGKIEIVELLVWLLARA